MNLPAWTLAAVLVLIAFRRLGGLSLGIWQIVLGGALLVVLTGSLSWRTAWDAIDWKVIGPPLILSLARAHHLPLPFLLLALAFGITKGSVMSPIGNPQSLEQEKLAGKAGQLAQRLVPTDLVIIDELGYLPFSQTTAGELLVHLQGQERVCLPLLELGATRAVIGQRGRLLSPPRSPIPYPAVRLEGSPPAGLWWCFLGNVELRSYVRSVRQPSRR